MRRLLEREIPEIYSGTVEVKSIEREPGQRSKVAVFASQPGSIRSALASGCAGSASRTSSRAERRKIDVVEWNPEVRNFITNALSPARPSCTWIINELEKRQDGQRGGS